MTNMQPFYVFDTEGFLISTLYAAEFTELGRDDVTTVTPPQETQTHRAFWDGGMWSLVSRPTAVPRERATSAQVQDLLVQFEIAPIEIFGSVIDCDDRSEKLMRDALASWDVRALDGEWFRTEYNGDEHVRVLRWKLTDNSLVQFTKEQLLLVYNHMLLARAARGQQLWIKAQEYKSNPPFLADIDTIEKWLQGA
jgi:hypothetical protein